MDVLKFPTADRELVFEFFAFFSRFEYALKNEGFLAGDSQKAEVNWDRFADSIKGKYLTILHHSGLKEAIEYLQKEPPKKQVISNSKLSWKASIRGQGESTEKYILRLVRCIRNNLFHGGKYPYPAGPVPESARNQRLIRAGLSVMKETLSLNPQVCHRFQEVA